MGTISLILSWNISDLQSWNMWLYIERVIFFCNCSEQLVLIFAQSFIPRLFSVGACNQLMECNSCQNLYHQDCHNPPIKVVARSHWECSDCGASKQVCLFYCLSIPRFPVVISIRGMVCKYASCRVLLRLLKTASKFLPSLTLTEWRK